MKKIIVVFTGAALLAIASAGCQAPKPMDDATIMTKVDSAVNAQMPAITDAASKNCDANSPAWIAFKADSLYNAAVASMK